MKVIAFNGSPRKEGNTALLLKHVCTELEEQGIECETVHLSNTIRRGCISCRRCREEKDMRCYNDSDHLNEYIEKIYKADGIIIGSPTYFADLSSDTKAFIERVGYVARSSEKLLKRKIGAAVVAVRRAGAINVFNSINAFFLVNQMIVPGSFYWNLGLGRDIGDVESDEEGIRTMKVLGQNMAWLMKRVNDTEKGDI